MLSCVLDPHPCRLLLVVSWVRSSSSPAYRSMDQSTPAARYYPSSLSLSLARRPLGSSENRRRRSRLHINGRQSFASRTVPAQSQSEADGPKPRGDLTQTPDRQDRHSRFLSPFGDQARPNPDRNIYGTGTKAPPLPHDLLIHTSNIRGKLRDCRTPTFSFSLFIFARMRHISGRPRCTRNPPSAWRGCESASWWRGEAGGDPCCVPLCAWYVSGVDVRGELVC